MVAGCSGDFGEEGDHLVVGRFHPEGKGDLHGVGSQGYGCGSATNGAPGVGGTAADHGGGGAGVALLDGRSGYGVPFVVIGGVELAAGAGGVHARDTRLAAAGHVGAVGLFVETVVVGPGDRQTGPGADEAVAGEHGWFPRRMRSVFGVVAVDIQVAASRRDRINRIVPFPRAVDRPRYREWPHCAGI